LIAGLQALKLEDDVGEENAPWLLSRNHALIVNPALLLRRDVELPAHLHPLQYDEFWVSEHQSSGW